MSYIHQKAPLCTLTPSSGPWQRGLKGGGVEKEMSQSALPEILPMPCGQPQAPPSLPSALAQASHPNTGCPECQPKANPGSEQEACSTLEHSPIEQDKVPPASKHSRGQVCHLVPILGDWAKDKSLPTTSLRNIRDKSWGTGGTGHVKGGFQAKGGRLWFLLVATCP